MCNDWMRLRRKREPWRSRCRRTGSMGIAARTELHDGSRVSAGATPDVELLELTRGR